jgi:CRISPR system Cascade subunit CasA
MNLLQDPWMPVRDAQGHREWITPDRLSEPRWRAFDADRPDFNGALAQFAIGLLQTTAPVPDSITWRRLYREPPDAATLRQWFEPVRAAFVLNGDGPRFMQDRYLHEWDGKSKPRHEDAGSLKPIQELLLESAGEGEKVEGNTDLFVKRKAPAFGLCDACTAITLYALQCNAPGGGRGYLVSIRGGGPLTTLLAASPSESLWQDLWLNVAHQKVASQRPCAADVASAQSSFPWMGDLRLLQPAGISTTHFEGPKGGPKPSEEERPTLQPSQTTPAHVFWGMPRRVLVDLVNCSSGRCGVCERWSAQLRTRFLTKNYGLNYSGPWMHPLSPYYLKEKEWLAVHPQPDGIGYRHWTSLVLGGRVSGKGQRPAEVVNSAMEHRALQLGHQLRIWAFGFDTENITARCWYEATLPLFTLPECQRDAVRAVQSEAQGWIDAAAEASGALLLAVRDAWFRLDIKKNKDRAERLRHVQALFWSETEAPFYRHLQALIDAARSGAERDPLPARESWHHTLTSTALRLFDNVFVGTGPVDRSNPRRVSLAHRQLRQSLYGPKLKTALGLPVPEVSDKPRRGRMTKPAATAPKESV